MTVLTGRGEGRSARPRGLFTVLISIRNRRAYMKDGPFRSRIGLPDSKLEETDRRDLSYYGIHQGSDRGPVRSRTGRERRRGRGSLAADPRIVQIGCGDADLSAQEPGPSGDR